MNSNKKIECIWNGISDYARIADIIFIENQNRKSILTLCGETMPSSIRLNNYYSELKVYGFLQIHNSYIVNINHAINIRGNVLNLKNNISLPISKRYLSDVKDKFREYISGVVL